MKKEGPEAAEGKFRVSGPSKSRQNNGIRTLEMAAAVKTMCADLAFRQTDGFDECFQRVKLQRAEAKSLGNGLYHLLVFGRISGSVFVEVFVLVAFQLFDDAARNQFQIALRGSKADEGATINQRRAGNAHVYLFGAIIV